MKVILNMIFMSAVGFAGTISLDFNKEIVQANSEQFEEHLKTIEQTKVTEASVEFEFNYRKPSQVTKLQEVKVRILPK